MDVKFVLTFLIFYASGYILTLSLYYIFKIRTLTVGRIRKENNLSQAEDKGDENNMPFSLELLGLQLIAEKARKSKFKKYAIICLYFWPFGLIFLLAQIFKGKSAS